MSEEPRLPPTTFEDETEDEIDDDFLYHLYQGGELLQAGKMEEARGQLEKAFAIKPRNARGQNLLGLVYFKLGLYARAIEIYRGLVERFPRDVTLRVNLAMVYLKAGMLPEAGMELEGAIQLDPGHEKAHRTLGLLLLRQGKRDEARQHFSRAGVKGLERFLASAGGETGGEAPEAQGMREARRQVAEAASEGLAEIDDRGMPFQGLESAPPRPPPVETPAGVESWSTQERGPRSWSQPPPVQAPQSFSVQPREFTVRLQGRCHARLSWLFWLEGEVRLNVLHKRFGGEQTQHAFGSGKWAMALLEGEGRAVFLAREGEFWSLEHAQGAAYFVEDAVCAFGDTTAWENGRLTAEGGVDLPIFHLFGPTTVVLHTRGAVRRLPLEGKILLPASRLAGWNGSLVPRLMAAAPPLSGGAWIELAGAGEVFLLEA